MQQTAPLPRPHPPAQTLHQVGDAFTLGEDGERVPLPGGGTLLEELKARNAEWLVARRARDFALYSVSSALDPQSLLQVRTEPGCRNPGHGRTPSPGVPCGWPAPPAAASRSNLNRIAFTLFKHYHFFCPTTRPALTLILRRCASVIANRTMQHAKPGAQHPQATVYYRANAVTFPTAHALETIA
eukprot:359588-Chlamydomonas_euryale.AAC.3